MFDKVCLGGEEVGEGIGWVRGEGRGGEMVGEGEGRVGKKKVWGCMGAAAVYVGNPFAIKIAFG